MNIQSSNVMTPIAIKSLTYCKTEDSGYHTSFTSPSLEYSSLSNDSLEPSIVLPSYCKIQVECYPLPQSADVKQTINVQNKRSTQLHISSNSSEHTPIVKRAIKRPYEEDLSNSVVTPTSIIACEVQKLRVNDSLNSTTSFDSVHSIINDICYNDYWGSAISHPTTPRKKICRSSCNLSPFSHRRSARKVDFTIHSLSCERQVLKLQTKPATKSFQLNLFGYKPNQKVDIIRLLYTHEDYCSTSIRKILSYLSQEDIYNFTLVSPTWCKIFKCTNPKQICNSFFNKVKSNLENWDHVDTPEKCRNITKPLKEIQNVNITVSTPRSPIRSPRTTRFNKFTKTASLDSRSQMACIKCCHPAKVTVESSGEEWVECTSSTCAYQYCKLCKGERHAGKNCIQYDLIDGPSPSKRKKNACPISSNRSKKKLKRLLF
ncbi:hypothetical protein ACJJTC_007930 [Scirpophaga incertulas]